MWLLFLTVEDELSLCSYDQLIGAYTNKETALQAQNNFLLDYNDNSWLYALVISGIFLLISRAYKKANEIQKENDLTI